MKKLIPVFAPMLFVTMMFLTFFFTHDVQAIFDGGGAGIPDLDRREKPEVEIPRKPEDTAEPLRALPVEDEIAVALPKISPQKTFNTPFTNRIYGWKKQGQFRHSKQITFNSDGTVTQNFWPRDPVPNFTWEANGTSSLVLKNSDGWIVDIHFEADYTQFKGYLRGKDIEFSGKSN